MCSSLLSIIGRYSVGHFCFRQELMLLFLVMLFVTWSVGTIVTLYKPSVLNEFDGKNFTCLSGQKSIAKIPKIPKILHQTWKDSNVPEKYRSMQESCKRLNPAYEYRLWTDADIEDLITKHYPWFLKTWRSYPYPIQRIDSGRLFLIHHFGGVYLDIDIECKVSLDDIQKVALNKIQRPFHTILSETDPIGITNNMMMSEKGTEFLDFATHQLLKSNGRYFTPHWTVMFSAGPLFIYRTVYLKYPCKMDIYLINPHDHGFVYFHHVQARTWHNWDGPFIYWFDYHGRTLLKVLAVLLVIAIAAYAIYRQKYRKNGKPTIGNSPKPKSSGLECYSV